MREPHAYRQQKASLTEGGGLAYRRDYHENPAPAWFRGVFDNTEIYHKLADLTKVK